MVESAYVCSIQSVKEICMADENYHLFVSERLIAWYEANKRDLPWRHSSDPYIIWISEIILQQTRVAQGLDYFRRFVGRFPDISSLAAASEDEVLRYWQGLGYYSRARNLHAAAKYMAEHYGGEFPRSYEEVRALKGIGDYTAAAIVSFAYGMRYAVVDGNVYRVLGRLLAIDVPMDTAEGKKQFAVAAESLLPEEAGVYNQAIMELGALVCTPRNPSCEDCPLSEVCSAFARHETQLYPVRQKKGKSRTRYFHYFYILYNGMTWLHRRAEGDIWQGLYEFPLVETESACDVDELLRREEVARIFEGCGRVHIRKRTPELRHVLSHQVLLATGYLVEVDSEGGLSARYRPVAVGELDDFAAPVLLRKLEAILSDSR